jgi:hypothetical protein
MGLMKFRGKLKKLIKLVFEFVVYVGGPRVLARPAQSPARGDGGPQHAPVLRESTMALIESVGPIN